MVVYFHKVECQAEKVVRYLKGQDHGEVPHNQDMTISKNVGLFATKLGLIAQHHKQECSKKKKKKGSLRSMSSSQRRF